MRRCDVQRLILFASSTVDFACSTCTTRDGTSSRNSAQVLRTPSQAERLVAVALSTRAVTAVGSRSESGYLLRSKFPPKQRKPRHNTRPACLAVQAGHRVRLRHNDVASTTGVDAEGRGQILGSTVARRRCSLPETHSIWCSPSRTDAVNLW